MYNAFVKQDIWICIPPIPNKYVRETMPFSLSYPLCLTLFTSFHALNMNPPLFRKSHYPYKYTKQKETQNLHKEIYLIFGSVDKIL